MQEYATVDQPVKKNRRIWLVAGAVLILSVILVSRWIWQAPAVGRSVITESFEANKPAKVINWIPLASNYFSLSYPPNFRWLNHNHYTGALEGNQLAYRSTTLVLTVDRRSDEPPGLRIRNKDSAYAKSIVVVDGQPAQIFIKSNAEFTAYISHGGLWTIIALSDVGPNTSLASDFSTMITSFRWK